MLAWTCWPSGSPGLLAPAKGGCTTTLWPASFKTSSSAEIETLVAYTQLKNVLCGDTVAVYRRSQLTCHLKVYTHILHATYIIHALASWHRKYTEKKHKKRLLFSKFFTSFHFHALPVSSILWKLL